MSPSCQPAVGARTHAERGRTVRWRALLIGLVLASAPVPPAGASDPTVRYELPLAAEASRRFRAPTSDYGPGHRGVDLAGRPGTLVGAAADGVVSHAGPVADTGWVSVAHQDGVVTSYGPLEGIPVSRGQHVRRGAPLGTLAAGGHGEHGHDSGLHWGARRDGRYIDPLELLLPGMARPSLVGAGDWRGTGHVVRPYEPWPGGTPGGWRYAQSPIADRPGFAVAPNANHVVFVAGLGTGTGSKVLDPDHLGLDPRSVTRFSYAGRSDAPGRADDPHRDQLPYGAEDTWEGVDVAARRLLEQLRAQAAREPGRAVDLVGHSMGGVVILRYLTAYHDPYDRSLPSIGHVVTLASPLQGSDLAAIAGALDANPLVGPVLATGRWLLARSGTALGAGAARLAPGAPAVADLSPGSALLKELATDLDRARREGPAGVLAMGTRILTVGGGGDQVVGAYRTDLPGDGRAWASWTDGAPPEHRVLPGGHERVKNTEAVREVVWRFLAGEEVVASPGRLAKLTSRTGGGTQQLLGWMARR